MALTEEMLENALKVMPEDVCIVPEKRQEITTSAAWTYWRNRKIAGVHQNPDRRRHPSLSLYHDDRQIQAAYDVGACCRAAHRRVCRRAQPRRTTQAIRVSAKRRAFCRLIWLVVNAGHGLTIHNVTPIAQQILAIRELNIGHSADCPSPLPRTARSRAPNGRRRCSG